MYSRDNSTEVKESPPPPPRRRRCCDARIRGQRRTHAAFNTKLFPKARERHKKIKKV